MREKRRQRGFALLLVFAMAGCVAILLYLELPRVVMQAQRAKEQTLIDRGEQYKRAIQLYVRKLKKYPQNMDELEKSNDVRFLRRRYVDPFSGKDDWRLVHIDASGVFTDSLVHKPPGANDKKEKAQTFVAELPSIGNPDPNDGDPNNPKNNAVLQRRASDRPAVSAGDQGGGAQPFPGDPNQPVNPADPNQLNPQQSGVPPYGPGGQIPPGMDPSGSPPVPGGQNMPGFPYPGRAGNVPPGVPGAPPNVPGLPLAPGQSSLPYMQQQQQGSSFIGGSPSSGLPSGNTPISSQAGGFSPQPLQGGQAGMSQGFGGTPGAPGAVPGQAADLIRQILTTPRQGGLPGGTAGGVGGMGGGVAGIASKREGEGVKVYNEKTKYKEWEFLYDFRKDTSMQQGAAGAGQAAQGGQFGQPGTGQPGIGQPGQFGQPGMSGSFGQSGGSGFGQSSGGFGQAGGAGQNQQKPASSAPSFIGGAPPPPAGSTTTQPGTVQPNPQQRPSNTTGPR